MSVHDRELWGGNLTEHIKAVSSRRRNLYYLAFVRKSSILIKNQGENNTTKHKSTMLEADRLNKEKIKD